MDVTNIKVDYKFNVIKMHFCASLSKYLLLGLKFFLLRENLNIIHKFNLSIK